MARWRPLNSSLTTVFGLSHQTSAGTQPKKLKAETIPDSTASIRSVGMAMAKG